MIKDKLVIGSTKPFAMLSPPSAFRNLNGTLGKKPVFLTMIAYRKEKLKRKITGVVFMGKYEKVIGIDVSKETLAISLFDGLSHKSYETKNSIESFVKDFIDVEKSLDFSEVLFMMENTGVYHLRLATYLSKGCGYPVSVANPLTIKRYSQMHLKRAKTDKADAKLIAEYGYSNGDKWLFTPPDELYYKIDMKLKGIERLIKIMNILNNQIEAMEQVPDKDGDVLKSFRRLKENFNKEIKKLEDALEELIKDEYGKEYKLLKSIPGVGIKFISVILGKLRGFRDFSSSKKVASYIGICPSVFESGTTVRGRGKITKIGNGYARKIMYLCSLSASKHNKACIELYERLVAKGKPKKVALIAVANKLLRQAFGVLKSGNPYDPEYEKNLTWVAKNA